MTMFRFSCKYTSLYMRSVNLLQFQAREGFGKKGGVLGADFPAFPINQLLQMISLVRYLIDR